MSHGHVVLCVACVALNNATHVKNGQHGGCVIAVLFWIFGPDIGDLVRDGAKTDVIVG